MKPVGDGRWWSGARGHGDGEAERRREAERRMDERARRVAMAGGEESGSRFSSEWCGWEWRLRSAGKGGRGLGIGVGGGEYGGGWGGEGFAAGPGPQWTEKSGACLLLKC